MRYLRFFFFLFLWLPTMGLASDSAWLEDISAEKLHVQPNGNVYVTIDKAVPNLGCPIYSEYILQLDTAAPNFEHQFSMLLAATMSDKKLKIYVKGCGDAYAYAQNTVLYREHSDPNSPAAQIIDKTFDRLAKQLEKSIRPSAKTPPSRTFLKAMMAAFQWVVYDAIKGGVTPKKVKEAKQAAHELAAAMFF